MVDTMTENRIELDLDFESTGTWNWENQSARSQRQTPTRRFVRNAGVAVFFAFTPITSIDDPWRTDETVRSTLQPVENCSRRRQISIKEAIRIADDIMRKAECERRATAEEEAVRFMSLEVDS